MKNIKMLGLLLATNVLTLAPSAQAAENMSSGQVQLSVSTAAASNLFTKVGHCLTANCTIYLKSTSNVDNACPLSKKLIVSTTSTSPVSLTIQPSASLENNVEVSPPNCTTSINSPCEVSFLSSVAQSTQGSTTITGTLAGSQPTTLTIPVITTDQAPCPG